VESASITAATTASGYYEQALCQSANANDDVFTPLDDQNDYYQYINDTDDGM
jgi:hypothetical protein